MDALAPSGEGQKYIHKKEVTIRHAWVIKRQWMLLMSLNICPTWLWNWSSYCHWKPTFVTFRSFWEGIYFSLLSHLLSSGVWFLPLDLAEVVPVLPAVVSSSDDQRAGREGGCRRRVRRRWKVWRNICNFKRFLSRTTDVSSKNAFVSGRRPFFSRKLWNSFLSPWKKIAGNAIFGANNCHNLLIETKPTWLSHLEIMFTKIQFLY